MNKSMGKYTNKYEIIIYQIIRKLVIPAGMRVSSAMDGKLKSIHGILIHFAVYGSGNLPE